MKKSRILAWLMTLVMMIGLLPATVLADDVSGEGNQPAVEELQPASVTIDNVAELSKKAELNEDGGYDVTLSVKAKQQIKSEAVEIVLVLDSSGSMAWCVESDSDFTTHHHSKDEGCYTQQLTCEKTEHSHRPSCYNWSGLVCGQKPHQHSDECYEYELACEKEEHYHSKGGWGTDPYCNKVIAETEQSRMDIVKDCAKKMVADIIAKQANVKIGIVDFDGSVQEGNCIGLTANKDDLANKINAMKAEGDTSYQAGLNQAYSYLNNNSGAKKVVVFLSDGENRNYLSPNTITDLKGIADIYTIGFATSNELLENIATDGNYSTADNSDALEDIFDGIVDKLIALVTDPIGPDVTLKGSVEAKLNDTDAKGGLNDSTKKIEWNSVEGLKNGDELTLTYTVNLKDASKFDPGTKKVYLNGDGAKLNYTVDGKKGEADFPQPYTTVEVGRLDVGVKLGDANPTTTTGDNQFVKVGNVVNLENYSWVVPDATKTVNGITYNYQYSKYDGGTQFNATEKTTYVAEAGKHKVVHYYAKEEPSYKVAVEYYYDSATGTKFADPTTGQDNPFTVNSGENWTIKVDADGGNYKAPKTVTNDRVQYAFDPISGPMSGSEAKTVKLVYGVDKIGPNGGSDGIPDKYQATVTFQVVNGTWDGTDTAEIVNVVNLYEYDEDGNWVKINPTPTVNVPTGMQPNANYTNGAWGETLGETVEVTKDATYTYTFAPVVPVPVKSIDVTKKLAETKTVFNVGETISWNITVNNTGTVALRGIELTDELTGVKLYEADGETPYKGSFDLGERESKVFVAKYVVTDNDKGKTIVNEAVATAGDVNGKAENQEANVANPSNSGGHRKPSKKPIVAGDVEEILNTEDHFQYVQGYPDGTVGPERNITRAEVTVIFFRLLQDHVREGLLTADNNFPDVKLNDWFNLGVSTMESGGFVSGYDDGTFKPNAYITRAELATIISNFDDLEPAKENKFADCEGHWAEKYINSAAEKGWLSGYDDGLYRPNQYITRAETMSMINRVLNRRVDANGLHKDAKQWRDNSESKWYYYAVLEATNHHDYQRADVKDMENWTAINPNKVWEN